MLDIGCGPGQVAECLQDRGLKQYHGFDFSKQSVEMAKSICPTFVFTAADALSTDLYDRVDYDAVLCLEVLEHVEQDIQILQRIRPGATLYASAPNYPDKAHVRVFSSCEEVRERYGIMFDRFRVDAILANQITQEGQILYVFEGVKK